MREIDPEKQLNSNETKIECPNCGPLIVKNFNYPQCPNCGSSVKEICKNCGKLGPERFWGVKFKDNYKKHNKDDEIEYLCYGCFKSLISTGCAFNPYAKSFGDYIGDCFSVRR